LVYNTAKQAVNFVGIRKRLRTKILNSGYPVGNINGIYKLGLPALLPSRNSKYWGLFFQSEHAPNRESRVSLSPVHKDSLGMNRVEVKVAFKEQDIESIVKVHNLFIQKFASKEFGVVVYREECLRDYLQDSLRHFDSYAHHMGTTRMSDHPSKGVVDKNAKVFGLNNLYIAGGSTFPTSSHANPTLTVVAQSLCLSDHLKAKLTDL